MINEFLPLLRTLLETSVLPFCVRRKGYLGQIGDFKGETEKFKLKKYKEEKKPGGYIYMCVCVGRGG